MAAVPPQALQHTFYGCLTHIELPLQFPAYVTPVYMGEAQAPGRLNLRDLAPEWLPHHPVLGGTAGTFAVRNWVQQQHPQVTTIAMCQYRKFVSHQRLSRVKAKSYPAMDVVPAAELPLPRLEQAMLPGPEPFGVSRLLSLRKEKGYLGQYGRVHHAQDLLRFAAEAVEQGVIGTDEAHAFMDEKDLIPGGIELGWFPAEFWLCNTSAVESVLRECIRRYPIERGGYQVRAWAFCAERLGSFLLLRQFRARAGQPAADGKLQRLLPSHWSRRFVGHLNIITESGPANYVPGGP